MESMPTKTAPTKRDVPANRGGSRFLGVAVSGMTVVYLALLPALLVVLVYLFISVYAIVKISPPGHPNPTVVLLGVVFLVALLTVLLAVAIWLIGKAFDPPKQPR